jgi:hypothetical protein
MKDQDSAAATSWFDSPPASVEAPAGRNQNAWMRLGLFEMRL